MRVRNILLTPAAAPVDRFGFFDAGTRAGGMDAAARGVAV
jgi:hypothetical protein